jgi:DNA-binding transcriptional LysR family regulator
LLASPRYAAKLGTLRDLREARFLTWGPELAGIAAARLVEEHVPAENIALRTSHIGTLVAAAEAGVGVLFLDRNVTHVRKLVEVTLSAELRNALPLGSTELWLVGHRALRDVPRIAATWDFLLAEAARGPKMPAKKSDG